MRIKVHINLNSSFGLITFYTWINLKIRVQSLITLNIKIYVEITWVLHGMYGFMSIYITKRPNQEFFAEPKFRSLPNLYRPHKMNHNNVGYNAVVKFYKSTIFRAHI